MVTEQLSESTALSVRGGAVWIGLSLLLCPGLPFAALELAAQLGVDLESAAIVAVGSILAAVATGRWIMLGRIANGRTSHTGVTAVRFVLPLLCPTVVALWAFVIVSDAAVVPYSVILVPLAAVVVICGPVATSVVLRADSDRGRRPVTVRRCIFALVQFPLSALSRSTVSIAESVKLRVRSIS